MKPSRNKLATGRRTPGHTSPPFLCLLIGFLLLMLGQTTESNAQVGPAGVDAGLVTWLDASDVDGDGNPANQPADGTPVVTWYDKSGSGNDATTLNVPVQQASATFKSDASSLVGGNPVLDFPGDAVYVFDGIDIRASNMPQATIFTVYFHTPGSPNVSALWGNDNGDWDRFVYTRFNSSTDGIASQGTVAPQFASMVGSGTANKVNLFTAVYDYNVPGGSSFYLSGKLVGTFHDRSDLTNAQPDFRLGWDGDGGYFYGRVAELLVYNRKLTDCEIVKINKYLSNKYQQDFLDLASNYDWAAPFDQDIAEIGTVADACGTTAMNEASSSIITISNPSSNDTAGEFLGIAHDGGATGSSTDVPSGYDHRITRVWRVDEDGDLGTIDLCFALSGLGYTVSDATIYSLVSDDDGSFGDATQKAVSSSINGNVVCFSGIDLAQGEYITLAFSPVLAPTITTFSPTTASEGDVVEIKGNNFTGATEVQIGGALAQSFVVVDDETIRAVVAQSSDGIVRVTNPAGSATATNQFTYQPKDVSTAPSALAYQPAGDTITYQQAGKSGVPTVNDGGLPLTYSLTGPVPVGVAIDPATGEITYANAVAPGNYTLSVRATNSKGSTTAPFVLLVTPASTPEITANQTFTLKENALLDAAVGTAQATDADPEATFSSWIIEGGNTDDAFRIDPMTGAITVNNPAALDYEKNKTFVLQITTSNGTNRSPVQTVTVQLEDVNEPPTIEAGITAEVDENSPINTVVASLTGTDAEGDSLVDWTIVEGNTGEVFEIAPNTGVITVKDNTGLDFETTTEYILTIGVSDGTHPTTQTVIIRVKDTPENADGNPVIFTAFSPNGDGVNDTWAIPNLGRYPNSVVKVFNSDGIELFANVGYTMQWDGTYHGRVMPLGTYYYLIKLNDESKTIYKGHLMIID